MVCENRHQRKCVCSFSGKALKKKCQLCYQIFQICPSCGGIMDNRDPLPGNDMVAQIRAANPSGKKVNFSPSVEAQNTTTEQPEDRSMEQSVTQSIDRSTETASVEKEPIVLPSPSDGMLNIKGVLSGWASNKPGQGYINMENGRVSEASTETQEHPNRGAIQQWVPMQQPPMQQPQQIPMQQPPMQLPQQAPMQLPRQIPMQQVPIQQALMQQLPRQIPMQQPPDPLPRPVLNPPPRPMSKLSLPTPSILQTVPVGNTQGLARIYEHDLQYSDHNYPDHQYPDQQYVQQQYRDSYSQDKVSQGQVSQGQVSQGQYSQGQQSDPYPNNERVEYLTQRNEQLVPLEPRVFPPQMVQKTGPRSYRYTPPDHSRYEASRDLDDMPPIPSRPDNGSCSRSHGGPPRSRGAARYVENDPQDSPQNPQQNTKGKFRNRDSYVRQPRQRPPINDEQEDWFHDINGQSGFPQQGFQGGPQGGFQGGPQGGFQGGPQGGFQGGPQGGFQGGFQPGFRQDFNQGFDLGAFDLGLGDGPAFPEFQEGGAAWFPSHDGNDGEMDMGEYQPPAPRPPFGSHPGRGREKLHRKKRTRRSKKPRTEKKRVSEESYDIPINAEIDDEDRRRGLTRRYVKESGKKR